MSTPRELLENIPFNQHVGVAVTALEDGRGVAELPERPETRNHVGSAHAGALYSLAETAAGACVLGTFAPRLPAMLPLVTTATVRYVKIARGVVTATAHLDGDVAAVLQAFSAAPKGAACRANVTLTDPSGVVVAEMSFDWFLKKL